MCDAQGCPGYEKGMVIGMKKEEALKLFLDREVRDASKSFVLNSVNHLKKEEAFGHIQEFVSSFQALLHSCRTAKENRGETRFIQIALVRSRALTEQPFYILEAFNKEFYLAEPVASVEADLGWLYGEYHKFCQELDRQSRKYIRCFDNMDLNRIKLVELMNCNRVVRHLFERSMVYIMNTEEYRQLELREGFQIHMGEYRGPFTKIFETQEYTDRIGRWWNGIL